MRHVGGRPMHRCCPSPPPEVGVGGGVGCRVSVPLVGIIQQHCSEGEQHGPVAVDLVVVVGVVGIGVVGGGAIGVRGGGC